MKTSYTPGPWKWVGRDLESNSPGCYEAVIESTVSCGSFCYGGSVDMKISDSDRNLIAAAPDLLEALDMIHKSFGGGNVIIFSDDEIAQIGAAIAKATGAE